MDWQSLTRPNGVGIPPSLLSQAATEAAMQGRKFFPDPKTKIAHEILVPIRETLFGAHRTEGLKLDPPRDMNDLMTRMDTLKERLIRNNKALDPKAIDGLCEGCYQFYRIGN